MESEAVKDKISRASKECPLYQCLRPPLLIQSKATGNLMGVESGATGNMKVSKMGHMAMSSPSRRRDIRQALCISIVYSTIRSHYRTLIQPRPMRYSPALSCRSGKELLWSNGQLGKVSKFSGYADGNSSILPSNFQHHQDP